MRDFIKSIIELLYDYKLSFLYKIHAALTLTVTVCFFWQIWARHLAQEEQDNPKKDKFSSKVKYVDYEAQIKATTSAEIDKLHSSKEYQKFLRDKLDPNSRYNQAMELSDIELSDDQDIKDVKEKKKVSAGTSFLKYKSFK